MRGLATLLQPPPLPLTSLYASTAPVSSCVRCGSAVPWGVSHAGLQRLLQRVGASDVSDAEVREMIAAANTKPRQRQAANRP